MSQPIDIQRLKKLEAQGCVFSLTGTPGRWSVKLNNPDQTPPDAKVQIEKYARSLGAAVAARHDAASLLRNLGVDSCLIEDARDAETAIADLIAETDPRMPIGIDLETMPVGEYGDALDPHRGAIRTVQLYAGGRFAAVIDMTKVPFAVLRPLSGVRLVSHNAIFETRFLIEGLGPVAIDCTMLLNRHLGGEARTSLAKLAWDRLGVVVPKEHQTADWSGDLSDPMIAYGACDAILVRRLFETVAPALGGATRAYEAAVAAQPAVATAMNRGIGLDIELHDKFLRQWKVDEDRARAELEAAVPGVDFSRPQQLRDWLERRLTAEQLAAFPRTPESNQLSTKKDDLNNWVTEIPELEAYARMNDAKTKRSRHGKLKSMINPVTGRIHPDFLICGAETGRMTCQNPNTQGQEKTDGWRRCFRAGDGKVLVRADFSQIELRIAALTANETHMLEVLSTAGGDIHRATAAGAMRVAVDDVTPEQRQLAKALNFGLLYGMGAATFREYVAQPPVSVNLTLDEAKRLQSGFFRTYPRLRSWQRTQAGRTENRSDRTAETVLGRRVRCVRTEDGSFHYTRSLNVPVQGSGADLLHVALSKLPTTLAGLDACPVLFVHDEIVIEVAGAYADEAKQRLIAAMTEAFVELFPEGAGMVGIVDAEIGKTWGG